MPILRCEASLRSIRSVAHNTTEVSFDVSSSAFQFMPGQYMTVRLPEHAGGSASDRVHDFSIVYDPNAEGTIAFAFRTSSSIFKQELLAMTPGETATLEGPKGVFTLPREEDVPVVLVAGGIGITPFLSMIRSADAERSSRAMTLLYYNRNRESAAYLQELEGIARRCSWFTLVSVFGAPAAEHVAPLTVPGTRFFVAGPPGMVFEIRNLLSGAGVSDEALVTEEFAGYE